MIKVFVYGTLKPGEVNYQKYCASSVVDANQAIALGQLFALPAGYPAMTSGDSPVGGYLLSFTNPEVLSALDQLEDYHPQSRASKNLYYRHQIETYDLHGQFVDLAWVYLMTPELVFHLGGVHLPDGWWSSTEIVNNCKL